MFWSLHVSVLLSFTLCANMHLHVSLSHCLGYVCHCLPVSYTSLTYYCLFYCVQTCLDTDVMSSLSRTHVSCNVFPFIHYYCLFYCVKTCTYVHVFPFFAPSEVSFGIPLFPSSRSLPFRVCLPRSFPSEHAVPHVLDSWILYFPCLMHSYPCCCLGMYLPIYISYCTIHASIIIRWNR